MSKASEELSAALGRVHVNAWNVAEWAREQGLSDVYIHHRQQTPGRGYQSAAWQVVRPERKTDPDGHWRDNGYKTFPFHRDTKDARLTSAKIWCFDTYGLDPERWAKIPGVLGSWYPKEIADAVKARIREWRRDPPTLDEIRAEHAAMDAADREVAE